MSANQTEIEDLRSQIAALDEAVDVLIKERDEALKKIDELQDVCGDSADRMVELRKERDAARRDFCNASYDDPHIVAKERGWDCFKEEDGK